MTDPTQQAPGPETAAPDLTDWRSPLRLARTFSDKVEGLVGPVPERDHEKVLTREEIAEVRGALGMLNAMIASVERRVIEGAAARDAEVARLRRELAYIRGVAEGIGESRLNTIVRLVDAALAAEPVLAAPVETEKASAADALSVRPQSPAAPAAAEGLDADLLAEALWAWGYDATGPVIRDEVRSWMIGVGEAWDGYWKDKPGHRYGKDFAAFVGERLMTDFNLRDLARDTPAIPGLDAEQAYFEGYKSGLSNEVDDWNAPDSVIRGFARDWVAARLAAAATTPHADRLTPRSECPGCQAAGLTR